MKNLRWLIVGFVAAWLFMALRYQARVYPETIACDFRMYYHAALGDYDWWTNTEYVKSLRLDSLTLAQIGWLYDDRLAILWKPFTLFPEDIAAAVNFCLTFACYGRLVERCAHNRAGVLVVLGTLRHCTPILMSGNVAPILALACVTEIGAALAPAIKPHIAVLGAFRAAVKDFGRGMA